MRARPRATSAASRVGEGAAVEQRAAVADDRDHGRLVATERRSELLLDGAGEARQLGERERTAPDPRDRLLDLAACRLGEPFGAGADRLDGLAQHAQHRNLVGPVERENERPLERGERELVGAQRALERVAAQALDQIGAADDDPGLRPAEQLVAREADEVGPCGKRGSGGGLTLDLDERARAEVVDERQLVAARNPGELLDPRLLGEADDAEVRLVDAEQQRRVRPDRALVVGGAGAVRRPDLDEAGARAREHVRDAKAVADLDQLAARDEHLAAFGERGEREQHRRGVVVDDERRLGAGQPPEQRREVVLARAARSGREVVLQVRVSGRLPHVLERSLGEWRPTQVRVHDHAGGVEDAAQRRPPCRHERFGQPLGQVAGLRAGADLLAGAVEHGPRRDDRKRVVDVAHQLVDGRKVAQPHETSVEPPQRLPCES